LTKLEAAVSFRDIVSVETLERAHAHRDNLAIARIIVRLLCAAIGAYQPSRDSQDIV
jgi:hypothetical protein